MLPSKSQRESSPIKIDTAFFGLGERFFEKLKRNRDKILQVDTHSGITETKGSVLNKSILTAMELRKRKVQDGDRVVICSRMNLDLTSTVLGVWYNDAIVCPIDPYTTKEDCVSMLQKLQPKLAFVDKRSQGFLELALHESGNTNCLLIHYGASSLEVTGTDQIYAGKVDDDFMPCRINKPRMKLAFIAPTEGATNTPKLVEISHFGMLHRCVSFEHRIGKHIERIITFYPFASYPNLISMCTSMEEGIVKILPGIFSEKNACRTIHDLRVDFAVFGTDVALKVAAYVDVTQDFELSCLKGILIGFGTTTAKDVAKVSRTFPQACVLNVYGSMEAGYISGGAKPMSGENADQVIHVEASKPGSVGRVFDGLQFKVIDLETSAPVEGADKWGELYISGPGLMTGYYNDRKATRVALINSYYKTADILQYDDQQYLFVEGRIYDQIEHDGHSYSSTEMEELILSCDRVKEVAIIYNGVEIIACVVIKEDGSKITVAELLEFINELTPDFKRVHGVRILDHLPKTPNGKIRKFELDHRKSSTIIEVSSSSPVVIT